MQEPTSHKPKIKTVSTQVKNASSQNSSTLSSSERSNEPLDYEVLGILAFKQQQFKKACEYFRKNLEQKPYDIETTINLCVSLIECGQYALANKELETLRLYLDEQDNHILINKKSISHHKEQGQQLESFDQRKNAIKEYEKALCLDPQNQELYILLSKALLKENQPEKARNILQEFVEKSGESDPQINHYLGLCYYAERNFSEAKEHWQKAKSHNKSQVYLNLLDKLHNNSKDKKNGKSNHE